MHLAMNLINEEIRNHSNETKTMARISSSLMDKDLANLRFEYQNMVSTRFGVPKINDSK